MARTNTGETEHLNGVVRQPASIGISHEAAQALIDQGRRQLQAELEAEAQRKEVDRLRERDERGALGSSVRDYRIGREEAVRAGRGRVVYDPTDHPTMERSVERVDATDGGSVGRKTHMIVPGRWPWSRPTTQVGTRVHQEPHFLNVPRHDSPSNVGDTTANVAERPYAPAPGQTVLGRKRN